MMSTQAQRTDLSPFLIVQTPIIYVYKVYVYIIYRHILQRNPADWKIPALKEMDLLSVELQRIAPLPRSRGGKKVPTG